MPKPTSRAVTRKTLTNSSTRKAAPKAGKTVKAKQAAFKKFSQSVNPGGLHKSLGIAAGQKIGIKRIRAAAKRPGLVGKQGRAGLNLIKGSKFKKKK